LLAVVLGCLWFGSIVYWASRDFVDSVPVGTDHNVVPPAAVEADVECHAPLSSTVRGPEPLPPLAPQPADQPTLAYTREPCIARRDSARQALLVDSVVFVGLLAAIAVRSLRAVRVRSAHPDLTQITSGPAATM
jgi:hypothetical protein